MNSSHIPQYSVECYHKQRAEYHESEGSDPDTAIQADQSNEALMTNGRKKIQIVIDVLHSEKVINQEGAVIESDTVFF